MKYLMNTTMAFALAIGTISGANAQMRHSGACDLKIQLTKKAEMQPGGAHFKGSGGMQMSGMKMDKKPAMKMGKMPGMKGAHEVHEGTVGDADTLALFKARSNPGFI